MCPPRPLPSDTQFHALLLYDNEEEQQPPLYVPPERLCPPQYASSVRISSPTATVSNCTGETVVRVVGRLNSLCFVFAFVQSIFIVVAVEFCSQL